MTPTLSQPQKEIIRKLRNAWELGCYKRYCGGNWSLQQGGLGKGGDVIRIKAQTAKKILEYKLIEEEESNCMVVKYHLSELGKTINID